MARGKYRYYKQIKALEGGFARIYLGKDKLDDARKLAQKAYISRLIKDKENELECVSSYIKNRKETDYKALLRKDSPYRALIINDQWGLIEYDRSRKYPEKLVVKAPKDEFVRSKSEALIANALFDAGIQYRYECALELDGITIYPDFTLKLPQSGKIVIWEHFGMMDNPEYLENAMKKISFYVKNGYFPGDNLIMTFETLKHPLSLQDVQKVIMLYLV